VVEEEEMKRQFSFLTWMECRLWLFKMCTLQNMQQCRLSGIIETQKYNLGTLVGQAYESIEKRQKEMSQIVFVRNFSDHLTEPIEEIPEPIHQEHRFQTLRKNTIIAKRSEL
jgi:hypothetical protein